jgi:hypothetical protein
MGDFLLQTGEADYLLFVDGKAFVQTLTQAFAWSLLEKDGFYTGTQLFINTLILAEDTSPFVP